MKDFEAFLSNLNWVLVRLIKQWHLRLGISVFLSTGIMHKDSLIKRASKSKAKVSRNSLFQFSWKDSSRNQWPLLLLHETPGYLTIKRKKEKLGGGGIDQKGLWIIGIYVLNSRTSECITGFLLLPINVWVWHQHRKTRNKLRACTSNLVSA